MTLTAKLTEIIRQSVAGLDPADRAERIAWCQQTGQHGVQIVAEGENMLRLDWGGRTLAGVERTILTDDGPLPEPDLIPDVPDDLQGLT